MMFGGMLRLLGLLTLCASCLALALEAIPPLTARVVDRTGTLSSEQAAALEGTLQAFEAAKGSQIAILIVPTTGEEAVEQYALRVVEQWQLGRKGIDDGALLLVAKNDRRVRIEVGYGLEGALNDAIAKRIVDEIIVPRFQQGDFAGGIAAGVERMIAVIEGEPLPAPSRQANGSLAGHLPTLLLLALFAGGLLRLILGRLLGAATTGGLTGLAAWWLLGALSLALVAGVVAFLLALFSGLGRYNGRRGGSWGSGSMGTGGFRGGGGGFGGGGASGRW